MLAQRWINVRKNEKEALEVKKHCNRNEEYLEFFSRLDMDEKIFSELEYMQIEIRNLENCKSCNICIIGILNEENRRNIETIFEYFPKLMSDLQFIDLRGHQVG